MKDWKMGVTLKPIVFGELGTETPKVLKMIGGIRNHWKNQNHPDRSIAKIGQNTEKSPGD